MSTFGDVSVHYSYQATEDRFARSSTSDSADIPVTRNILMLGLFF